jgi:putative ABC transport system permease protein
MGGALTLVATGLLFGVGASAALVHVMITVLDFVQRPGVSTYASVVLVFLSVAAAAAFTPALRAMRVDPMQTLRSS